MGFPHYFPLFFILSVFLCVETCQIASNQLVSIQDWNTYFRYNTCQYGIARVCCSGNVAPTKIVNCSPCANQPGPELLSILSRAKGYKPPKGIFVQEGNNELVKNADFMKAYDDKSIIISIRACNIKGKEVDCPYDASVIPNTLKNAELALFTGDVSSGSTLTSYSKEALKKMTDKWREFSKKTAMTTYLAVEATALSGSSITEVKFFDLFKGVNVIIYNSQHFPDLPEITALKDRVDLIRMVGPKVKLLLPGDYPLRLQSYLPTVSWSHQAYQYQRKFLDVRDVHRFKIDTRQLIELEVDANDKLVGTGSEVHKDHIMQMVDSRTIVLFQYQLSITGQIPINHNHYAGKAFIVVPAVVGPNYVPPRHFVYQYEKAENINHVIGFVEKSGRVTAYEDKHFTDVMEIAMKMNSKDVGLRVRADFLAKFTNIKGPGFVKLLAYQKLRWLFVHEGKEPEFTQDQLNNLKRNIRLIRRETYLLVNSKLRSELYVEPKKPTTPPPPTTTTTTPDPRIPTTTPDPKKPTTTSTTESPTPLTPVSFTIPEATVSDFTTPSIETVETIPTAGSIMDAYPTNDGKLDSDAPELVVSKFLMILFLLPLLLLPYFAGVN